LLGGPTDTTFDDLRTAAILRRVAKATGADVLDFQHLRTPVDDRSNPLVNSRAKPSSYATHSLKPGGTWEAFCEERLSKSYRADNRRNWRRRLREQGTPRIVLAGSVEQALGILESTSTQKARRYYATGRLNPFAIDAHLEFYRRMTTRHHPSGLLVEI
jgi:CelD/BcsL family acetyltransferase involved in cellulose biosynthesis